MYLKNFLSSLLLSIILCNNLTMSFSSDFSDIFFQKLETKPQLNTQKKAIIFDLGNVLVTVNKKQAIQTIGLKNIIQYWLQYGSIDSIRLKFYSLMNETIGISESDMNDFCGDRAPKLLYQLMNGEKKSDECIALTQNIIQKSSYSQLEKKLMLSFSTFMFNPIELAKIQKINTGALNLIKECHRRGYTLYIISNFDNDSFILIKEKFPELFSYFDNSRIIISSVVNMVKPEPEIFHLMKQRILQDNIIPTSENCFFIDDQIENVLSAEKCGITGIKCSSIKDAKNILFNICDTQEINRTISNILYN